MSIACPAYADEVSTEYSSDNVPEGYLGMILDEYGNITELIPMPNNRFAPYVDNIFTIEPKHSFVSYQYAPEHSFGIGFGYLTADSYGKEEIATTRNRMLRLEICAAYSIGGNRTTVMSYDFSTNYEDRYQYKGFLDEVYGAYITLGIEGTASGVYYNGKVTNLSSESADMRILVSMT